MSITFEKAANSGTDQHLCGTFISTLTGNAPVIGTGTLSQLSGPSLATFANPSNPTTTATVTAYGTYEFNWRIENGGFCSSDDPITVVYNPVGQVNLISGQVLCNNGATTAISLSSANGSTIFNWVNSAPGIGLALSGSGDIASFTATNVTNAPVVANIVVTPYFTDGVVNCPGPTKSFPITVNTTAQVNQPTDLVICAGSPSGAINFTTANAPGTTTYSWTNSDATIGLAGSGTGNIASFNAVNAGITPVTATIIVIPKYNNGSVDCSGLSKTFTITVNPKGQVTKPSDLTLCHNGTGTVSFSTINANGATTYSWTNSNTAIGLAGSGTGNSISFTGTNAGTSPITGTITVTPTFSNGGTNCPGTPEIFVITVNPTAQVNQLVVYTFCNGLPAAVPFTTNNSG